MKMARPQRFFLFALSLLNIVNAFSKHHRFNTFLKSGRITLHSRSILLLKAEGFQSEKREYHRHAGSHAIEDLAKIVEPEKPPVSKKISFLLLLSYCGAKFHGSQLTEGERTVEGEVERALFKAGYIRRRDYGNLQRINWKISSKSDVGVSALTQVVSLRVSLPGGADKVVDNLNQYLPKDIRCMDLIQTSNSFNARSSCTKRRYQYLLPTYMLMEPDALTKLLDEAYQQAIDIPIEELICASIDNEDEVIEEEYGEETDGLYQEAEEVVPIVEQRMENNITSRCNLSNPIAHFITQKLETFRLDSDTLARFRQILQMFVGAKKFHNFAYQKGVSNPSSMRYIQHFKCSDPFIVSHDGFGVVDPSSSSSSSSSSTAAAAVKNDKGESEWVLIEIVGQSFMFHQIRKLIGTAIDFARKPIVNKGKSLKKDILEAKSLGIFLDRDVPNKSFNDIIAQDDEVLLTQLVTPCRIETVISPGIGLYLDNIEYKEYNQILKEKCEIKKKYIMRRKKYNDNDNGVIAHHTAWRKKRIVCWDNTIKEKEEEIDNNNNNDDYDYDDDVKREEALKKIEICNKLKSFKILKLWKSIFKYAHYHSEYTKWLNHLNLNPMNYKMIPIKKTENTRLNPDRRNLMVYENTKRLAQIHKEQDEARAKKLAARRRGGKKTKPKPKK